MYMTGNVIIKVLPALDGNCFLVSSCNKNILIDGGYINTYKDYLKPLLYTANKSGFDISLVIVTHIDADHISGIVEFIKENNESLIIPIRNIWHNSFRHIQNDEIVISDYDNGEFFTGINQNINDNEKNISAKQGSSLAKLLFDGEYNWNLQFDGKAVSVRNNIKLDNNISIDVLSPDKSKLELLQKYWRRELYKEGYINTQNSQRFWDDAFEILLTKDKPQYLRQEKNISHCGCLDMKAFAEKKFIQDLSATNGSSISIILNISNKKILFLGDSHPDIIIKSLRNLYSEDQFPIFFDAIQLSHHGSYNNNSPELLSIIRSDKYVISTNSNKYSHPDIETIACLLLTPYDRERTLFFNYQTELSNLLSNPIIQKIYNYRISVPTTNQIIEIEL